MVKSCSVKGCKTVWQSNIDVSFFSFPIRNKDLLEKWLENVPCNQISKYSHICSNHFEQSQYEFVGPKRMLKKGAIPFKFLDNKKNIEANNPTPMCQHEFLKEDKEMLVYLPLNDRWDQAVQVNPETKNVTTQVSPKRLKPSEKEENLHRRIKTLQSKLRRREQKLSNVNLLLNYFKKKDNSPMFESPKSSKTLTKKKEIMETNTEDNVMDNVLDHLKQNMTIDISTEHNAVDNSIISEDQQEFITDEDGNNIISIILTYEANASKTIQLPHILDHDYTSPPVLLDILHGD